MKEKELGMQWFNFYSFLFILRIIGAVVSVLITLVESVKYHLSSPFIIGFLALLIMECAFIITTYIQFKNRTPLGYKLNMVYIFLSVLIAAQRQFLEATADTGINMESYGIPLALTGIFLLVWSVPNYIYFKNRKFLFEGTTSDTLVANSITNQDLENPEQAVEELDKDSDFTSNEEAESVSINNVTDSDNNEKSISNNPSNVSENIPVEALKKLKDLYDAGIFTEEEFAEKKKRLLKL